MRLMSFSMTEQQMLARTKTATRRLGWLHARVGDEVQPVRHAMGLKRWEAIERVGLPIVLLSIRKEPLQLLTRDVEYGARECVLEGFPHLTPEQFVSMFIKSHRGCEPATQVTRIEFRYA